MCRQISSVGATSHISKGPGEVVAGALPSPARQLSPVQQEGGEKGLRVHWQPWFPSPPLLTDLWLCVTD